MNPMTFEEWIEGRGLNTDPSHYYVAQKAWNTRQQEVDALKKHINEIESTVEFSGQQFAIECLEKEVDELKQKNAMLTGLIEELWSEFGLTTEQLGKLARATSQDHIPEVGKMVEKSCESCEHDSGDHYYCKTQCTTDLAAWQPKEEK